MSESRDEQQDPGARGRIPVGRTRLRQTANWMNLATPLGLAVAGLGGCRLRRGPDGLVLAEGYRWPFPAASAFTVGDVVITAAAFDRLLARCPGILRHEGRHSWHWAVCLGLPFLPLYTAAMGWSWLRTGDRARANVFERHAGLVDGGYLSARGGGECGDHGPDHRTR